MQAALDNHLKMACDMTEVGETASRVDSLLQEAGDFEKLCNCDLETAASVIDDGMYAFPVLMFYGKKQSF